VGREINSESMSILQLRDMHKRYGGADALRGVDFALEASEIHALLGGNGAGKSTLIKILAGVERADSGTIEIHRKPLPARHRPFDVFQAGVRFVHQDLALFDELSISENIALGADYVRRRGLIDYDRTEESARNKLARMDSKLAPHLLVGSLSQAEKVIVAIARVLDVEARIIVLDEVTASLPSPEALRLRGALKAAKARGVSFIYVTHRIEEIFGLCDQVTVLANGRRVATDRVDSIDSDIVINWIVGQDKTAAATKSMPAVNSEERLSIRGVSGGALCKPVSFSVRPGEVLGLTGLIGSGYHEISMWLAGLAMPATGALFIDNARIRFGCRKDFEIAGCQVVIGDRSAAAFASLSVRENLFPNRVLRRYNLIMPSLAYERSIANKLVLKNNVRPVGCAEMPLRTLSGGNQQKLLFIRALESQPRVLILVDPTAGVDVGGRRELYEMLHAQAARGVAVILASSDFDEVVSEAHRALVLGAGRLQATLTGADLTAARLMVEAHSSVPSGAE
jgi:ribose transport system ATP-binding protein